MLSENLETNLVITDEQTAPLLAFKIDYVEVFIKEESE